MSAQSEEGSIVSGRDEDGKLGERVVAARRRLGWTREALAVNSGLSWAAVSQIESGRRPNPRADTLFGLAGALGVSVDYLTGRPSPAQMLDHHALIYETDDEFAGPVTALLAEAVDSGDAAFAVTTAEHVEMLKETLGGAAKRVQFAESGEFYSKPVTALGAYRRFVTSGIAAGSRWVLIVGEPVWPAGDGMHTRRWEGYESGINLVFASMPVTLVCPYDASSLPDEIMATARETHPKTMSGEDALPSADYRDPIDFIFGE
jgi:transcriptional regulator with XRE-family HTH domain